MVSIVWPIVVSLGLLGVAPALVVLKAAVASGDYAPLRHRAAYAEAAGAFVPPFLTMTFLIFMSTSTVVFSFYKCEHFEEMGARYNQYDYTVDCESDR